MTSLQCEVHGAVGHAVAVVNGHGGRDGVANITGDGRHALREGLVADGRRSLNDVLLLEMRRRWDEAEKDTREHQEYEG